MNPYITNLYAEDRYHERNSAADRATARARKLRAGGDAGAPAHVLPLTSLGRGVSRPHWWTHVESGEPVPSVSGCSDAPIRRSA